MTGFWRRYFGKLPDPTPPPADVLPTYLREEFHNLNNKHAKLEASIQLLNKRQDAIEAFFKSMKAAHGEGHQ